ncbi:hypothetical protein E0Z10_g950 [Xylaria hypoxylon]|uniref:AA1-like domain-containing protein n=1 Tax=Xylaria hypoxylon TaxID=37992 RepID=A0A4Z0YUV6_9PEZI|nr:hypothetical protein E0Z10_g950 [Xylaria hypoxylon]
MRASTLTLLSAATLASAAFEDANIVVERSLGCGKGYENTTVQVSIEHDYANPEILNQVSSLYQVDAEYTYFCFAYKPDGSFYSDEWFGLDKPLHLSTKNVVVEAITCRVE